MSIRPRPHFSGMALPPIQNALTLFSHAWFSVPLVSVYKCHLEDTPVQLPHPLVYTVILINTS